MFNNVTNSFDFIVDFRKHPPLESNDNTRLHDSFFKEDSKLRINKNLILFGNLTQNPQAFAAGCSG